jgi:hypothetical protein
LTLIAWYYTKLNMMTENEKNILRLATTIALSILFMSPYGKDAITPYIHGAYRYVSVPFLLGGFVFYSFLSGLIGIFAKNTLAEKGFYILLCFSGLVASLIFTQVAFTIFK